MLYNNIDNKKLEVIKEKVTKDISEYLTNVDNEKFIEIIRPGIIQSEFIELITNSFIKTEFELFMGYAPYQRTDSIKNNYRNGSHNKKFKTSFGEIKLTIPEDRNSEFYPTIISKYNNASDELVNSLLELFKLGLSNKEIVSFIENVYGSTYSPQNISNITEVISEVVDDFKSRAINKEYFALFIDATYIPIRFDRVYSKQAIYLICGITHDGYQEVLGYTVGHSENTTLWDELLYDLKSRGLVNVDIFVMDGAPGVDKVVKKHYPTSDIQICTVHTLRNIMNKISPKDKSELIPLLRDLFLFTDLDLVYKQAKIICDKFPKYQRQINNMIEKEYLFTYLKYPNVIHKTIKSTNRIEAINQKIKTRISHKRAFPNEKSLEKILVAVILELNVHSLRKVNGMESYLRIK